MAGYEVPRQPQAAGNRGMDILWNTMPGPPAVLVEGQDDAGRDKAVNAFLERYGVRALWVRLSRLDNYTPHFWQTFTGAVGRWNAILGAQLEKIDFPESLPSFHHFSRIFFQFTREEKKMVLIFDSCQVLSQQPLLDFLDNLASSLEQNISLLLLAGAEASARLPDGLEQRKICFSDRNLHFTLEETGLYCAAKGVVLTRRQLEEVHSYTGGWAFAVYLFVQQLAGKKDISDPVEEAVAGVFGVLEREVFAFIPPDLQRMLVKLSLLDSFTPELASCLSGIVEKELAEYAVDKRMLLFIPKTSSWRFQEIFSRFLRKKQALLSPKECRDVFRKAAQWYERKSRYMDAARCYSRCGDCEGVCRVLLEKGAFRMPRETALQSVALLREFSVEHLKRYPMARVLLSSCYHSLMELDKAEAVIRELLTEMEGKELAPRETEALGEANILLGMYSMARCTYQFVEYFQRASQYLPVGSRLINRGQMVLGNSNALCFAGREPDALERMVAAFEESKSCARKAMGGCAYGLTDLATAEAHYYRGEFGDAERFAFRAIYGSRSHRQLDITCNGYFLMMRVAVAMGNYPGVKEYMGQMEKLASESGEDDLREIYDVASSWFHMKMGQWDRVADWIKDDMLNRITVAPVNAGRDRVIRAGYLLVNQRYCELLAYVEDSVELCLHRGQRFMGLKLQIIGAIACHLMGEGEQAVRWLAQTCEWANANRVVVPFSEMGKLMRSLAEYALRLGGHGIPREWLTGIRAKSATYAKYIAYVNHQYEKDHKIPGSVLDKLSTREKEVLRCLCQGLAREEIAEELGVSANTVKALVKRLYNKMGVSGRSEAVRVATLERMG